MRSHPLQKILIGKSIDLCSDGLCMDRLRIDTDYFLRISLKDMTMSDILVYAQHQIDRARHKLDKEMKDIFAYTTREMVVKEIQKQKRRDKKHKKEWSHFNVVSQEKEYDVDFEYQYIQLAQEFLQFANDRFPDSLSNDGIINYFSDLLEKYSFPKKETSYGLSMKQMCKERLNALDEKSHIVDLCNVYDILIDIVDSTEHFKPYNVSYGEIQIDLGGICFMLCDHDEYNYLSKAKQKKLQENGYLLEFDVSPVDNMRYYVHVYIPEYVEATSKKEKYSAIDQSFDSICHKLCAAAINDFIQEYKLMDISLHSSVIFYKNDPRDTIS